MNKWEDEEEDEDDNDNGQCQAVWTDAIIELLNDYEPALSRAEADIFWSTMEISTAISTHCGVDPAVMDKAMIYNCLKSLGYHYTSNGGLQMDWMLKRKEFF